MYVCFSRRKRGFVEADTKKLIVMVGLCRSVHAASHAGWQRCNQVYPEWCKRDVSRHYFSWCTHDWSPARNSRRIFLLLTYFISLLLPCDIFNYLFILAFYYFQLLVLLVSCVGMFIKYWNIALYRVIQKVRPFFGHIIKCLIDFYRVSVYWRAILI